MERYDKIFYLIEAVVVTIFIAICHFISIDGFEMKAVFVIILLFLLTVLTSTLNLVVLAIHRTKNKSK